MTQPFPPFGRHRAPSPETLLAMQSAARRLNEHLDAAGGAYAELQDLARSEDMSPSIGNDLGLDWGFMESVIQGLTLEEATVHHHLQSREGEAR